jgi:DNA repair protein RadD
MKLRDYQNAAVQSIFDYFAHGGKDGRPGGNPLVGMPTGTGKSLVLSEFIRRAYTTYPGQRIIKLTHVKELIAQNHKTLRKIWPNAPAGIYSAGLGKKQACFPVTFAGIASVYKQARIFGHIDIVLIDEAHLLSPKQGTMYQSFLGDLKDINPYLRVVGFTATHYRVGQGLLTEGEGIFDGLCFDLTRLDSFNWLLTEGYLSPLIPKRTSTELPVEGVRIQGGEYVQSDLQEAVDKNEITSATLREAVELATDREHWLVFGSGINHVLHITDALNELGITATCVHSKMPDKERDKNIADFKAGRYKAMVNNGILTTGFDFPEIDLIVMLRPTNSPGLWVQMLGRGTRPVYAEGFDLETATGRIGAQQAGPKKNCLVLDFAGNTRRLGPINDPVLPRPKGAGGGGAAPVKLCEACGCYNHASVRFCVYCRVEFPIHVKLQQTASTDELIKTNVPKIEKMKVSRVTFREHRKQRFDKDSGGMVPIEDRPPVLRVTYLCGLRTFDEWICLEHEGFPGRKAREWWKKMSKAYTWAHGQLQAGVSIEDPNVKHGLRIPETVEEAISRHGEINIPSSILIHTNRPHPEITGHEFES